MEGTYVICTHSTKKKLNDYFEFPMDLNLENYTQEYLNKKDIKEKLDSGVPESELSDYEKALLNLTLPPEYYQYKLRGVVLHAGTADFGHYTSISYDRECVSTNEQKWFEFNDSHVRGFNADLMQVEAFGGKDEGYNDSANKIEREHSAMTEKTISRQRQRMLTC